MHLERFDLKYSNDVKYLCCGYTFLKARVNNLTIRLEIRDLEGFFL